MRTPGALLRCLLLVAALALPLPAHAHGTLRSSDPRAGARLTAVPRELRLTFSEAVELAVARLTLTAADGRAVPLSPLRRGATSAVIVADVADPGALSPGGYTVSWQVVGHDGHPVKGSYRFTILPGAAGLAAHDTARAAAPNEGPARGTVAPPMTARDSMARDSMARDSMARDSMARAAARDAGALDLESPLYIAARWLGFLGLLGLVGAAAFGAVVLPNAVRRALPADAAEATGRRARTLAVRAATLLAVACLLRLAAQSAAVNGAARALDGGALAALVTGTAWGRGWSLQLGAALVALVVLALSRERPARAWLPVAVCAAVAALGATLSGHAMAEEHHPALAVVADVLHVLAAGGWLGALVVLAAAALPAARRLAGGAPARVAAAASLVGAFSPWALACAAVAVATGTVSAWLHLGAPAALWSTTYGRTLLLKLALLVPAALAGANNWRRVRPALAAGTDATGELSQSVGIELLAALAVVAVTAVLVALPL